MPVEVAYIHYGDDTFRRPKPIVNRELFTKPRGGLWASRRNDPDGWKVWCEEENFRLDSFDRHFQFTLSPNAKILILRHECQLLRLPKLQDYDINDRFNECYLDFEKLAELYDAIEVRNIRRLYWPLYGWDCNSILVMNPDVVNVL